MPMCDAGSNYDGFFDPQLTSYDYDAPLTEAGDPTDKYMAIRAVVDNVNDIFMGILFHFIIYANFSI